MKHIAKALICLMLAAVLALSVCACSKSDKDSSRFPNTQSGFRFEELSEAVLDITQSFKLKDATKDGYIPGAEVNVTVAGYSELSYFDAEVTLTWYYEYLDDNGDYVETDHEVVVELDALGAGTLKEKIEFDEHRSIRNINLALSFDGYAIKK